MNKQWENDIKDRLAAHEEQAPELTWTEIDAALADRRKAARTPILYIWPRRVAVAAAVAALVGGVGMLFFQDKDKSIDTFNYSSLPGKQASTPPLLAETEAPDASDPPRETALCANPKAERLIAESSLAADTTGIAETPTPETSEPLQVSQTPTPTDAAASTPKKRSLDEGLALSVGEKPRSPRLMAQAWLGGGTNSSQGSATGMVMVGADAPFAEYVGDNMQNNAVPDMETEESATPAPPSRLSKADHRTPLRLGLGLRYCLGGRWSVAAGISYSYLASDLEYDDGSKATQKLHYVGIPVQLSYALWRTRHAHLYASVGGEVEKMVHGNRTTTTPTYDAETEESRERLHIRALQYSATASVGLEYLFAKGLALYVEPGASYHFKSGSDVPTLYQDKPFSFNLNLGLRLNIK